MLKFPPRADNKNRPVVIFEKQEGGRHMAKKQNDQV